MSTIPKSSGGPWGQPSVLPTRIFKSGNSLSVRIPKEMVPSNVPQDAEIQYDGTVWTIRPIQRRKLTGLAAKFRAFSPGFMAQGRSVEPEVEREWPAAAALAASKPKRKA